MQQINYEQIIKEEKPFADRLALFIRDIIRPNIVLDIGCGPGIYVHSMNDLAIQSFGIDIDDRVLGKKNLFKQNILDTYFIADTCICLEVFEHIDSEYNDDLVEKVSKMFQDTLIFSAAVPGQGGVGHINCQTKEYWSDKFLLTERCHRNYLMEDLLKHYCQQGRYMGWFYNNVMIFSK